MYKNKDNHGINSIESGQAIKKINNRQIWYFDKINQIDKF